MDNWKIAEILIGGIATLAIFSFIIKENPVYRFFEHLFIGIAAGFLSIYSIRNFLWPKVISPMFALDIEHFPDGTQSHEYNPLFLVYLIPMAFGLLYYFIYSRKYGWLAKIVIGFSLGMSGGLAFKGFFNEMIPQLVMSFRPLYVETGGNIDWLSMLENLFFVAGLLAVMYYFFFSFKAESTSMKSFASGGRWLMMVCFGAFFGSTVMARMALLVERLQFLLNEWFPVIGTLAGA